MNYTDKDIRKIIDSIIPNEPFTIIPIGNHTIGRHLVYKVNTNNEQYTFKIYYIKGKRIREINSSIILKNSGIIVPSVIDYGEYDGHEWVIMKYINGEILADVFQAINEENILCLFRELGETLGKIHSYKTFDYALGWDKKVNASNYERHKIITFEKLEKEIINQDLPDKKLLYKAIGIIKNNYKNLFSATEFRLTHNDFDGRNILVEKHNKTYKIKAVIDFEQSYPDNFENDLANLYFKYFIKNKQYEKYFLEGYSLHMKIQDDFYNKLKLYLILMVIEHCSWSYKKANDYYVQNINFLYDIINICL